MKKRSIIIKCFLFFIIFLSLPAIVRPNYVKEKETFNNNLLSEIIQIEPEYIFIGNSMLNSRIDIKHLDDISNNKNFMFDFSGSLSAEWYLMLKNFVTKLEKKPKAIFLFFRSQNLTNADTNFEYNEQIRQQLWHREKEEHKLNKIIISNRGIKDQFHHYLKILYPIINFRKKFDDDLSTFVLETSNGLFELNLNKEVINQRLNFNDFRVDELSINDEKKLKSNKKRDFDEELSLSFLPEIMNIVENYGTKIILVRVQDTPPPLPYHKKHSLGESEYIGKLSNYCDEIKICTLFDLTGHPLITNEMYSYRSHIKTSYKKKYTEIFFNEIFLNNLL